MLLFMSAGQISKKGAFKLPHDFYGSLKAPFFIMCQPMYEQVRSTCEYTPYILHRPITAFKS